MTVYINILYATPRANWGQGDCYSVLSFMDEVVCIVKCSLKFMTLCCLSSEKSMHLFGFFRFSIDGTFSCVQQLYATLLNLDLNRWHNTVLKEPFSDYYPAMLLSSFAVPTMIYNSIMRFFCTYSHYLNQLWMILYMRLNNLGYTL